MKNLLTTMAGAAALGLNGLAYAQSGNMMNGDMGGAGWMGMHGGYGGYWGPVLLVVVIGLVAWVLLRRRK